MRYGATILLAVLAAALGLYVWLVEIRGSAERERAAATERRVLDVRADEITELELPLTDGGRALLVRDGGWRLASPLEFPSDTRTVDRALEALEELESELVIDPPTEDLSAFGLSAETREVIAARTADRSLGLYLGADAPIGSTRYFALEGEGSRIFTAERSELDPLSTSLYELRDKRLTQLAVDEIVELQVRAAGSLIATAVRGEDEWRLVAPGEAAADSQKIERLLQDLVLARASEFIDDPRDLSLYGLVLPERELSLARSDGSTSSFELGRSDGTGYVRVDGAEVLYAVPERLLDGIPHEFFGYRFKRVFGLDEAEVKRIELSFPTAGVAHRFERRDNEWVPEDESMELKSFAIEDLLFAIHAIDAIALEPPSAVADALGLDPASVRVTCFDESGGLVGWLELGGVSRGGLAARSSQSDRIWRVAESVGEDVPLGLEAFENRFVVDAEE
jgi:hypothetical protein